MIIPMRLLPMKACQAILLVMFAMSSPSSHVLHSGLSKLQYTISLGETFNCKEMSFFLMIKYSLFLLFFIQHLNKDKTFSAACRHTKLISSF